MARIVGGIGLSHAPGAIAAADRGMRDTPAWQGLFADLDTARAWLRDAAPDLIVVFYNDHLNAFFFDAYPTLAIGVAARHPLAPEAGAVPPFPDIPGDPDLAGALAEALIERDFDLTVCQELALDHGAAGPLRLLATPDRPLWPAPVVPICVNTIRAPLPRPARLFALGRALADAVTALPGDARVVVLGTGGLSHQLHGPRAGLVAPDWDQAFLRSLAEDPAALAALHARDYAAQGGAEGLEMMMWLGMRGALPDQVRTLLRAYHPAGATGIGLLVLEPAVKTG